MWGRLVAVAWQATLSKDLDHLPLAAAVEAAVHLSEGVLRGSEGGRGRGNPDLLHLHQGDHQDQGLLEVGDLHQTEAGGMEAAAVVAAAAVALPTGAADAAGRAVADAAAASSSAGPKAAAASAFPPPPFSFFPPPPPSFSSLPPRLYYPKEEEQAQG